VIGVVFAAAPLYLAAAGLVVLGEGHNGCPTAASVSERLSQLLADEPGDRVPDALIFDGESGALRVRLLSSQGSLREQKNLDLQGSCDELADAVATVAVAWRSQLQSDDVPPPVLEARVHPVIDEASPPPPARSAAPPQPDFEIVIGAQTVAGDQRWAPGILLGARVPVRRNYGVTFTFSLPFPRFAQDPTGKDWRWVEASAVIAPSFRGVTENFLVDMHMGVEAGVNITTSESLRAPDSYRVAPPALAWGLRWTYRRSNARPWLGLGFSGRLLRALDSPIHNADIRSEAWVFGVALGGTLSLEQLR
jgi:hypothetical protein